MFRHLVLLSNLQLMLSPRIRREGQALLATCLPPPPSAAALPAGPARSTSFLSATLGRHGLKLQSVQACLGGLEIQDGVQFRAHRVRMCVDITRRFAIFREVDTAAVVVY